MVDASVFSNKDQIANWLSQFSARERHLLSSRASLRIFSSVCLFDAYDMDEVILLCSRCLLVNCLLGRGLSEGLPDDLEDIEWAAESAVDSGAAGTPGESPADSAGYAAAVCSSDPDLAALAIEWSVEACGYVAPKKGRQRAISALLVDGKTLEHNADVGALWPDDLCTKKIDFFHRHFLDVLAEDRAWHFWRDWYLGMWDGAFDKWELAQKVVLIEDSKWSLGKRAVAKQIRKLEAQ